MQQFQQPSQQLQTRQPVLIFLKNVGPPLVLYVDNTNEVFEEIKQIILNASKAAPKLIEKVGNGPLKKLAVFDTQIAGVAIQEEAFMG